MQSALSINTNFAKIWPNYYTKAHNKTIFPFLQGMKHTDANSLQETKSQCCNNEVLEQVVLRKKHALDKSPSVTAGTCLPDVWSYRDSEGCLGWVERMVPLQKVHNQSLQNKKCFWLYKKPPDKQLITSQSCLICKGKFSNSFKTFNISRYTGGAKVM